MTFKIKPKDRQILLLFKPAPDGYPHAHVDIARMVYYKRATYAEVTGEESKGAAPFEDIWGCFQAAARNIDGTDAYWRLTGRNDTANVERCVNEYGWLRSWSEAHALLVRQMANRLDRAVKELDRIRRDDERVRGMTDPKLAGIK